MTNEQDGRELRGDDRIEALMPWLRRNELDKADQQFIKDDISRSADFEAKLAQENDLAAALNAIAAQEVEEVGRDNNSAWADFKNRLPDPRTEEVAPFSGSLPNRNRGKARVSSWRKFHFPQTKLGWLATVQMAALAALAFLFIPAQISQDAPAYTTLSSAGVAPPTAGGDVILVFKPSASEADIREVLGSAGAQITRGPMANGGYIVSLEEGIAGSGMQTLRRSDAVTLAEPLDAGPQP